MPSMSTIRSDRDRAIQVVVGPCAIADRLSPASSSRLAEGDVSRSERSHGFGPADARGVCRVSVVGPMLHAAPARTSGRWEART